MSTNYPSMPHPSRLRPAIPSSVPLTPEIAPQIVSFKPTKKSFVIHSSRQRETEVMFGGTMIIVPAADQIIPTPAGMTSRGSEVDAEGELIPGTIVIEDIYTSIPGLGEYCTFDAERAVILILGITKRADGTASALTSAFARAGLSLLPRHPPKSLWHQVAIAGEQRAFLAAVETARTLIEAVDVMNATRKGHGMATVTGGADYEYAVALVQEYNNLVKQEAGDRVAPYRAQAQEEEIDEELELLAYTQTAVMKIAEKASTEQKVDKMKLFDELMDNPQVRLAIQKKYRFRKRGHEPMDAEALEKAAASGATSVKEAGLE